MNFSLRKTSLVVASGSVEIVIKISASDRRFC